MLCHSQKGNYAKPQKNGLKHPGDHLSSNGPGDNTSSTGKVSPQKRWGMRKSED